MRFNGFVGTSYTAQSPLADCEESINWYRERVESPFGKTDYYLAPTPGFQSYISGTTTRFPGGRGLAFMNNRSIAVIGEGAFEVHPNQTVTHLGDMALDANPASIAWTSISIPAPFHPQAMIASGNNLYVYDLTANSFAIVSTPFQPTQVAVLDDFGIAFDSSTGKIFSSKQHDFTSWDPTQFAIRPTTPDSWRAMVVNPPDIWLIGSLSGDVWYDAGGFPFPFGPRTGLNFKYGIAAPWSLVAVGYSNLWVSQTPEGQAVVVRTSGYAPQRISTYAIEQILTEFARVGTLADAEGTVYQEAGHTFYVLRFPSANATYVYDLETNDWHRRAYWNAPLNRWDAWNVRVHAHAFGRHLTLDPTTNTITQASVQFPTELDGTPIRRLRRAPGPFLEHRRIPIRRLEYYLEVGTSLGPALVTTPPTPGSPAYVMHRTSDDGGRTYGPERLGSIGAIGQYGQPGVRFSRLGIPRDRVTEFSVSDPITSWRIIDAYLNTDAPGGGR